MIAHSALAQNCVCSSSTSDRFICMHACSVNVCSPYLTITPHLPNLGQALWMAYPKTIRYAPLQNNIT